MTSTLSLGMAPGGKWRVWLLPFSDLLAFPSPWLFFLSHRDTASAIRGCSNEQGLLGSQARKSPELCARGRYQPFWTSVFWCKRKSSSPPAIVPWKHNQRLWDLCVRDSWVVALLWGWSRGGNEGRKQDRAEGEVDLWWSAREVSIDPFRHRAKPLKPHIDHPVGALSPGRGTQLWVSLQQDSSWGGRDSAVNCEKPILPAAGGVRRALVSGGIESCTRAGIWEDGLGKWMRWLWQKGLCSVPNAEQAFSKCSFFLSFNFVTASENGFWSLSWVNQLL